MYVKCAGKTFNTKTVWLYTLIQFMREISRLDVKFVDTNHLKRVKWRDTLNKFMKKKYILMWLVKQVIQHGMEICTKGRDVINASLWLGTCNYWFTENNCKFRFILQSVLWTIQKEKNKETKSTQKIRIMTVDFLKPHKISAFYLHKQKSFVPKKSEACL